VLRRWRFMVAAICYGAAVTRQGAHSKLAPILAAGAVILPWAGYAQPEPALSGRCGPGIDWCGTSAWVAAATPGLGDAGWWYPVRVGLWRPCTTYRGAATVDRPPR